MLGKNFSMREIFTALLMGIAVACLAAFLYVNMIVKSLYNEQEHVGERLLGFVAQVDYEIQKALKELNSLAYSYCDDTTLKEMRKAVFRAQYVKDIGFFDGNALICTTGSGILKKPFVGKNIPDYIGNDSTRIWTGVNLLLFEDKYSTIIIRKGDYNAVLDHALLEQRIEDGFLWQINYLAEDKENFFAGQESFDTPAPDMIWWKAITHYLPKYHSCSKSSPHCVNLRISDQELESRQTILFDLILIGCVFLGFISAFLTLKYFTWNKSLRRRVINAVKADEISCRYQPIVDLSNRKIIGVEVLARLQDRHGSISPQQFIPIILETKMCWRFTKTISKKSLTELATLPRIDKNFEANINIFPTDIVNPAIRGFAFLPAVTNFPGKINFDILESPELHQPEAKENSKSLHDLKIIISIDDFGTGYSNMKTLRQLTFNQIKIDIGITKDIDQKSIRSSLVPHIVNVAKELDKIILAEGIETKEQLEALINLGVQRGQGWLLGKPMNFEQLMKVIEENRIEVLSATQRSNRY